MNYLVVCRYEANVDWLENIKGWKKIVVQKQTEEVAGDMPNVGREPAAFIHAILKYYDKIQPNDIWAFVQDNPYPHCLDMNMKLGQPFDDFTWLGGDIQKETDGNGHQDHPNLPVAEYYKKWTGDTWHEDMRLPFAAGGQFMVSGDLLLRHSKEYYQQLYDDVCLEWIAWCAERLWASIFTVEQNEFSVY